MRPKLKIYITLFIVVTAMGFLLFAGFDNQTMVYYSTVKELKTKGASAPDRGFRVGGMVLPGSVVKAGDKIQVQFDIVEDGETLHIVYNGILPDSFKEDSEVLVEGAYHREGYLMATNVLTKCASKYEAERPSE